MNERDPDQLTIPPDGRPPAAQPKWRRDFPIDAPEDQYVARREFTKFLVLTSFAFVAGQFWILAKSLLGARSGFPASPVARLDELPVGGFRQFDYPGPGQPKLLVRIGDREVVAFDQRCTHLSCPVLPQVERGRFHCPCHNGNFDLATGRPLSGPPRRFLGLGFLANDGSLLGKVVQADTGTQGERGGNSDGAEPADEHQRDQEQLQTGRQARGDAGGQSHGGEGRGGLEQ